MGLNILFSEGPMKIWEKCYDLTTETGMTSWLLSLQHLVFREQISVLKTITIWYLDQIRLQMSSFLFTTSKIPFFLKQSLKVPWIPTLLSKQILLEMIDSWLLLMTVLEQTSIFFHRLSIPSSKLIGRLLTRKFMDWNNDWLLSINPG